MATVKAFKSVILKGHFEINDYFLSFCVDSLLNQLQILDILDLGQPYSIQTFISDF